MAVTLTKTGLTATGDGCVIYLSASGMASGYSFVEYQVGNRPDFRFCIAPVIRLASTTVALGYINQDTSYYARARSVMSSGATEAWGPVLGFRTPLVAAPNLTPPAVMIQPAVFVVPEPALEWQSASAPVTGYPVENLGVANPVAWRTTDPVSGTTFGFDVRTAGGPVDTISILNSNLPETAQIIIYGANDRASLIAGTPAYNSGYFNFRASPNVGTRYGYHSLVRLPAPISYPWMRVVMTATVPAGILHAEHAIFGLARMTKNFSGDMSDTPIDLGSLARTRAGTMDAVQGFRMRKVGFDLSFETESQYQTKHADMGWRVGSTDPVLVVPNSKAGAWLHDRILYGNLSAAKFVNPVSPRWTTSWTVDSII